MPMQISFNVTFEDLKINNSMITKTILIFVNEIQKIYLPDLYIYNVSNLELSSILESDSSLEILDLKNIFLLVPSYSRSASFVF